MENHFHKNFYKELKAAANAAEGTKAFEMLEMQAANYALEYHTEIFGKEPEECSELSELLD